VSYSANLSAASRVPVTLVRVTLDWCTNSFGVAPCTASGEPCYNTYHTCKARAAYLKGSRVYEYCSANAPVPWPGPRPYVKAVTYLPTEITNTVTVTGRIKVELLDEPDCDVGVDPYLARRSSVQGTYWKKLLARNPNYRGRTLDVFEGFLGDPFSEFRQRARQPLQLASVKANVMTLQSVDLLQGLADIEVPPALDVKLLGDLAIDAVELVLDDTTDVPLLPDAGYIKIGDEVIQYGALNRSQRKLSGCTRAAMGSTAATHTDKDSVQICRYYPPANPFNILEEMLLVDAGFDVSQVDIAAIGYWRDWPGGEVNMTAFLDTPTKLADLLLGVNQQSTSTALSADLPPDSYGLVDLLDCKIWVGEDLKITIARNIANAPGRAYREISDAATVISASASVDMNEKIRVTRSVLYWDKSVSGAVDAPASYARRDIGVNGDAETEYAASISENVYCRWLKSGIMQDEILDTFISDLLARRLFNRRDAAPIITLSTELKDSEILTGSFLSFLTDELLNPDGTPIYTRFQVIRRDAKGSKVDLKVQRMPVRRCCFYAPEDALDYATATPAQREYGGFYNDDQGRMPNGDTGFYYY
jgi:hypothetical protein